MLDQVLAGYEEYPHYFAVERYYTGGSSGPNISVYLSKDVPVVVSASAVSVGAGVRVDCYTSAASVLGASRFSVSNVAQTAVSWGAQDFVCGDSQPTLIGGVRIDLPSSYVHQANQAGFAAAAFGAVIGLLLVFVVLIQSIRAFR
jgi:hypothetical protein